MKKFLNSINYFRGIAIIMIVLGHCYNLGQWNINSKLEQFFYSLTLNGTVFFVFISGFLYYHVFYHKFEYKKFISKKICYVLVPYLVFSAIPVLLTVFLGAGIGLPIELKNRPLLAIIWYFATGKIIFAYWYIPMAMLLFVVSPLFNWIIRSNNVLKTALFLLPISLVVHRPFNSSNNFYLFLNSVHNLIYFMPVYLLGIWSSINNKKIYAYLQTNKRKAALIFIAIALGVIQIWVFQKSGNFHKEFWSITVPDVNLLQKIVLCFLLMSILDIYENNDITVLKKTAETSFAIYFIHPFLIKFLNNLAFKLNVVYQGNFFTLILATLIVVTVSMAIAYAVKAVFKKNSRYLIGW